MTETADPPPLAADAPPAVVAGPGRAGRWMPWAVALVLFAVYAVYSLSRDARLGTAGFDLGIFDQAVRSYAHFRPPYAPLKGDGFVLLGDHFHPILVLLVPAYWVWPDARVLLLAQAALLAASAVPVGRLAVRRLGVRAGTAVTVAYGLSWGLAGALAFDVHEVAFGVPLLACCMVALAEGRWRAAVLWALPLLLVKEDLGLTVAAAGAVLVLRRQWRAGVFLAGAGVAGSLLAIFVFIPLFSPSGSYRYFGYLGQGKGGTLYHVVDLPASFLSHPSKAVLVALLIAVTAGAALRSPLILVGVPILLYRLISGNPLYWSTGAVHYNAILMPVVFAALLDALPRLAAASTSVSADGLGARLSRAYARFCPAAVLLIALALVPHFALWSLADPAYYRVPAHVRAAERVLRLIPSGARVAAGDYLAPKLTDRCTVILFPDLQGRTAPWVVIDTTHPGSVHAGPGKQLAELNGLPAKGYTKVAEESGVVLYHHP